MSVVDRNRVFTIRHILGLTNWVSVPVKRENAEALVKLSAGDKKFFIECAKLNVADAAVDLVANINRTSR
jgi:hypothetical protein